MKNTPINNGKDVQNIETEEVNLLTGKFESVKKITSNSKNNNTYYELKRNNRWVVTFSKPYDKINSYVVKTLNKSKLINGSWSDIIITLYDSIGPSTSQALMEGIRFEWQNNREIPRIEYKLNMLDPTGVAIEEWLVTGKLKEVDFGDLDYSDSEITKIKLLIEPISVILNY